MSHEDVARAAAAWAEERVEGDCAFTDKELALLAAVRDDDEYPPEVEYPDDHSPFCPAGCTHECHRPYDEWAARQRHPSRSSPPDVGTEPS